MTAITAPEMDFLRGMLFGFEGTGGTTIVCVLVSRMLSTNCDAPAGASAFLSPSPSDIGERSVAADGVGCCVGRSASGADMAGSGLVFGISTVLEGVGAVGCTPDSTPTPIGGTGAGSSGNALVSGTGDGTG